MLRTTAVGREEIITRLPPANAKLRDRTGREPFLHAQKDVDHDVEIISDLCR